MDDESIESQIFYIFVYLFPYMTYNDIINMCTQYVVHFKICWQQRSIFS